MRTARHLFMAAALLLTLSAPALAAGLDLVTDGKSGYVIYCPPDAPESVEIAAGELQTYLQKVSGARLPIVRRYRAQKVIALGDGPHLARLGLGLKGVPIEGYRIVTRGDALLIFGPDTADGQVTPDNGFSRGTQNGVYTFIERHLGVRWLMPGEVGEYVPRSPSLRVPATDSTEGPGFLNRRLPYIRNRTKEAKLWSLRQKLGYSVSLRHYHHWRDVIRRDMFAQHPDYFAEIGGRRVKPVAGRYKVCTSNPAVARVFAERALADFRKDPHRHTFSASPSDGGGWCECKRCRDLDEIGPDGKPRITRRILSFYNAVARQTAHQYPKKFICGYVYAAYQLPPLDPDFKVHPNVFLVWAAHFNYGMTHFRPEVRELWHKTLRQWARVTPNLAYYDLCNNLQQNAGAPNPPCRKILKSIMPALKRAGVKGVYIYGLGAWGHAAALNYARAKLAWEPEMDVDALCDEFYDKCYGKGAPAMRRMYDLLEARLEETMVKHKIASYRLNAVILRDVYGREFWNMEKLYKEAEAKAADGPERKRLAMFRDNMVKLCMNLRQLGMIENAKKSVFYLPDEEYARFLKRNSNSLAIQVVKAWSAKGGFREMVKKAVASAPWGKPVPVAERVTSFRFRGPQVLVCRTELDQEVEFGVRPARQRGNPVNVRVYDPLGKVQTSGGAIGRKTFRFFARQGVEYYIVLQTKAIFTMRLPNAPCAASSRVKIRHSSSGVHFLGATTPLYFHVPEGVREFGVILHSGAPGETATAVLYNPANRPVATFRTVETPVDEKRIPAGEGAGGIWKLKIAKAERGYLDDVWVTFGKGLSGWFSLDPKRMLVVKP